MQQLKALSHGTGLLMLFLLEIRISRAWPAPLPVFVTRIFLVTDAPTWRWGHHAGAHSSLRTWPPG
jgi:hypothetical protein